MAVSYNKLFKLLLDRHLMKKDLMKMTGLSSGTITKLAKNEYVHMEVLDKVCKALKVPIEAISEIYDETSVVEQETKRAWIFIRSSMDVEFQFASQEERLKAYCEDKGYQIVGKTAFVGDCNEAESEMESLYERAEGDRAFDVLLMANSNRLSVDTGDIERWVAKWSEREVALEFVQPRTVEFRGNTAVYTRKTQTQELEEYASKMGYVLIDQTIFGADKESFSIEDLRTLCYLNDFQPEAIGQHVLKLLVKSSK